MLIHDELSLNSFRNVNEFSVISSGLNYTYLLGDTNTNVCTGYLCIDILKTGTDNILIQPDELNQGILYLNSF